MRYDAEQKARTRARVLKEAVLAIRAGGPENLGVANVMKRAGLTHGGFYAHFPSREALLSAAIGELFTSASGVFERMTRSLSPREALAAYVGFYLSTAHRDALDFGCPLPLISGDLPRMRDVARLQFAQGVARLTAAIAARLGQVGHPEPETAAASALAEMVGALSMARAMGATTQSDTLLANTHAAVLGRLGLGDDA